MGLVLALLLVGGFFGYAIATVWQAPKHHRAEEQERAQADAWLTAMHQPPPSPVDRLIALILDAAEQTTNQRLTGALDE